MATPAERVVHDPLDTPLRMLEAEQGGDDKVDDAAACATPCEEELLLECFHELETPEGFRAEFIEGEIIVTPPPSGRHEKAISRVIKQVMKSSGTPMDVSGQKGLLLRRGEKCTRNYLIPDLVLAPEDLDLFGSAEPWMPPQGVALVLEVTSTRADRDRKVKRHCYAKADIPLYLLVDREKESVTLFREPDVAVEDYLQDVRVPYGKPIEIPAPFEFVLDTAEFC